MFRIVRRVAVMLFVIGAAVTLWQRRVDRPSSPRGGQSEARVVATTVVAFNRDVVATPGWHSVTLPFDDVLSVASFIQPDSHIDVVVLPRVSAGEKPRVDKVIENVRVLKVGDVGRHPRASDARPIRAFTLTVEVESRADVERLIGAMRKGDLRYMLRGQPGGVAVSTVPRVPLAQVGKEAAPCTNQRGDTQVYDAVRLSCMRQSVVVHVDTSTVRIMPPR